MGRFSKLLEPSRPPAPTLPPVTSTEEEQQKHAKPQAHMLAKPQSGKTVNQQTVLTENQQTNLLAKKQTSKETNQQVGLSANLRTNKSVGRQTILPTNQQTSKSVKKLTTKDKQKIGSYLTQESWIELQTIAARTQRKDHEVLQDAVDQYLENLQKIK